MEIFMFSSISLKSFSVQGIGGKKACWNSQGGFLNIPLPWCIPDLKHQNLWQRGMSTLEKGILVILTHSWLNLTLHHEMPWMEGKNAYSLNPLASNITSLSLFLLHPRQQPFEGPHSFFLHSRSTHFLLLSCTNLKPVGYRGMEGWRDSPWLLLS